MNRYWDLTERERSELTSEQVQAMMTVELMEKGVVKIERPELIPVEEIEPPELTLYVPKSGYRDCQFGFKTSEEAMAFMAASVSLDYEYVGGETKHRLAKNQADVSAVPVQVYSSTQLELRKSAIEKNKAAVAENQRRLQEYNAAVKAEDEATKGVWEDWHAQIAAAARHDQVVKVFRDYTETCDGSEPMAFRFLNKAFDADEIKNAFAWHEIEIPTEEPLVAVGSES